jgi:uncharacterized protein YjaZ
LTSHLSTIQNLSDDLKSSATTIRDKIQVLVKSDDLLKKAHDRVTVSADLLKKNLKSRVAKKLKAAEITHAFSASDAKTVNVPQIVTAELMHMIRAIRVDLTGLVVCVINMLVILEDLALQGLRGIDAFKTHISFDVFSPHMRAMVNECAVRIKGLSAIWTNSKSLLHPD